MHEFFSAVLTVVMTVRLAVVLTVVFAVVFTVGFAVVFMVGFAAGGEQTPHMTGHFFAMKPAYLPLQ